MTEDALKQANELKQEIKTLDWFMDDCKNCWKILRVIRPNKLRLITSYGAIRNEIEVSEELADEILMVMYKHKLKLMLELERL